MKVNKKILNIIILSLLCCMILSGCGQTSTQKAKTEDKGYLTVTDDLQRSVTLAKKPEKIIVLSPSFLEPLHAVDAKLIARPTSKNHVPDFAKNLEEVGSVYNINIEKVVALQPDLVIAYEGMHDKFVPILESNHIPVLVVRMKTYQEVLDRVKLFAQVTGEIAKGDALTKSMQDDVQQVIGKIPKEQKKIAILHSTAKSVTVQLEGSIAGSTAKMLGFNNVAVGSKALEKDPDSAPYSLEKLVESDPEIIFVVTMGNMQEIKKRMMEDVESNPAWSSLNAVKNKHVYFLPQELFLLNPGVHYPEAFATMAKLAYPEVFGSAK